MTRFPAFDGTLLAHRTTGPDTTSTTGPTGSGAPLVCLPGGPTSADYLGDLGGLAAHRPLVLPDWRGTGRSARPADPASHRCDRLVDDVEALRVHLGAPTLDLLAHSAGANVAARYAERHPERVRSLVLVGPGTRAVGVEVTGACRLALARRRAAEPWFPDAFAALNALVSGSGSAADAEAVAPFFHGRWDEAARAHHAAGRPADPEVVAGFGAEGAFDPERTRAALAGFPGRVLVLTGEFDLNSPPEPTAALAALFPRARHHVQPGAGHSPWVDDPAAFTATVTAFLAETD
ncbi:alpha/beta fold hydrolase (plasmid) [Streptomyces sp. BI20]|uniref:alpha/beta fold hydrolase n=1 Tax=Streptomyces sp. BI20 TaxID=3403460 RepID=UPI003C70F06E